MKNLIFSALLWIDGLALKILSLGKSHPGEWISSALWSLETDGKLMGRLFRPAVDFLFGVDHCRQSWLSQQHIYPRKD